MIFMRGCPILLYEDDIHFSFILLAFLRRVILYNKLYYCYRWNSPKDNLFGFGFGAPSTVLFWALFICVAKLSPLSLSAHSFKYGRSPFTLELAIAEDSCVDFLPYLVGDYFYYQYPHSEKQWAWALNEARCKLVLDILTRCLSRGPLLIDQCSSRGPREV